MLIGITCYETHCNESNYGWPWYQLPHPVGIMHEPASRRSLCTGIIIGFGISAVIVMFTSGCLTRTRGPQLPYVKPAQSAEPVNPMQLRFASRLEALEEEIRRLRDIVERAGTGATDNRMLADLNKRVSFIEQKLGIPSTPVRGAPGTTLPPAPAQSQSSPEFDEPPRPQMEAPAVGGVPPVEIRNQPIAQDEMAFRQAYALVRKGSMEEAFPLLEQFVKQYPKSPYAANAVYWMGEALLARGRYEEAVLQFDRVIKEFPGSRKELDALLKQGQAFAKMGDTKSARIIFDQLIKDHPHTSQARLARTAKQTLPSE